MVYARVLYWNSLLLFQKLWNDRIKDVKLRCTAEFSLCARQECPVGWAALGCSFSFMAEQLQFHICLTCFKLNHERQKNVTEPPQTLTEVTSSVSDQTKRFNLRKINNCFNARIILSILLPGGSTDKTNFPSASGGSDNSLISWSYLESEHSPFSTMN